MRRLRAALVLLAAAAFSNGCALITVPYHAAKNVVEGSVWVVKTSYVVVAGTTKTIYRIGQFTFTAGLNLYF